uniref:ABC transporter domain-containing protein n=1 Tax=Ascaris lumbricoides TaxID=6252 RepID=A0A0M3ISH4_ASCLU
LQFLEAQSRVKCLQFSDQGKTTLLNVLTQRNLTDLEVDGVVRINGQQLSGSDMHHICAYVQQDDLFVSSMTVKEHLTFYAELRMGRNYSSNEKRKRVDDIIRDLGLCDCANSYVGQIGRLRGISGGERKRLAFACEILTSPPLLFCDEPTSGVDSFLAQQVVQVLKRLAHRKGMTIVVTVHQPSSQVFAMFDRIHLMAQGRVAFNGRPSEAIEMWNSWLTQMRILIWRSFLTTIRDPVLLRVRLFQTIVGYYMDCSKVVLNTIL